MTDDDKDAFWLAQAHFNSGNYTRTQSFLAKHDLVARSTQCRYLAAHCYIKQSKYGEALEILGETNPAHLVGSALQRKKVHAAGHTRTLSKTSSKSSTTAKQHEDHTDEMQKIKFEAAMCYLRGLCYSRSNAYDRAKECYKFAVQIDVQCYEAFEQLMKNNLMSPDEEWTFLETLDFDSVTASDAASSQEAAEFVKMLYITRLSKYKNPKQFQNAADTLTTHYKLANNPDLELAKASLLHTQCRFREAFDITSGIILDDKYNFSAYPIHIACLYELGQKNALFLIAHDLADVHPEEPCAWLAVATYYLISNKVAEARRYYSKASVMDPHFGPAWIGFAHTFAAEGEHDQAISAYSTAARLFMGTHLPQMFLGMQNLLLNNLTLAEEFLKTAYQLCGHDPLLLNEMGVVAFHQDKMDEAIQLLSSALYIAEEIGSDPAAWVSTRANLGHAYRRLHEWAGALSCFNEVVQIGTKDHQIFCARGLVLMEMCRPFEAVKSFHEALAISPQDPIATELLGKALEETVELGMEGLGLGFDTVQDSVDIFLSQKVQALERRKKAGDGKLRRYFQIGGQRQGQVEILEDQGGGAMDESE